MDEQRDPGGESDDVLSSIDRSLKVIHERLDGDSERAAARERIIDRLHDENQRLRAGERHIVLRPVLVDLQRMRTELLRVAGDLPADYTAGQAAELLRSFAYSAELALERGGVTVLRPTVGDPFDPVLHRAARILPAGSAEADGTVAGVLGDGYFDVVQGRPINPASVSVHRWTEPETPATEPAIPLQADRDSVPAERP